MKHYQTRRARWLDVVGLILLLAGAALLFAPLIEGAFAQHEMNEEISKVAQVNSDIKEKTQGESLDSSMGELRDWLESYNQQVLSGSIGISSDPFSFTDAINEFGSRGLEDGLIGYIQIPAMSSSLPLYLGSTKEHLKRGATVVEGSSAPLGETTSNCVIAAHRGYGSPSMMFRDIEKLLVGDKVYVTTLWETLTYTVVGTKVIDPSDTAAVGIQQGRDLVTLITCHPYGSTARRYVVECERRNEDDAANEEVSAAQEAAVSATETRGDGRKGPSLPEIEDAARIAGGIVLIICAAVLTVRTVRDRQTLRTFGKHSK